MCQRLVMRQLTVFAKSAIEIECYCDDIWLEETPPCFVDVVRDLRVPRS
jgi:hypothetical protein